MASLRTAGRQPKSIANPCPSVRAEQQFYEFLERLRWLALHYRFANDKTDWAVIDFLNRDKRFRRNVERLIAAIRSRPDNIDENA